MIKITSSAGHDILIDKETFVWAKDFSWNISPRGYARTHISKDYEPRKYVPLHRLILNAKKGELVDHINRNKLDNRTVNLRITSSKINSINRNSQGTSKYKGVALHKSGWQVYVGGKYIGFFKDELLAAKAYDLAATKRYGDEAVTNQKLELL